ncbi:MAG: PDZ domain-containing protein [Planctomycetota bacterium JB042]
MPLRRRPSPTLAMFALLSATTTAGVVDPTPPPGVQQAGPTPPAPILARLLEEQARPRNVIGVHVGDVDPSLAAHLGLGEGAGILVTSVTAGMPADRAGMRAYDVVVAVDGEEAKGRRTLSDALDRKDEGDTIELTLLRGGKRLRLTVEVTAVAADPAESLASLGTLLDRTDGDPALLQRRLVEVEARLDAMRAEQTDREAELEHRRNELRDERQRLRESLAALPSLRSADPDAARRIGRLLSERRDDATARGEAGQAAPSEARALAAAAEREAEVARLRARTEDLERALDRNLARLDSTRNRLATETARLRSDWRARSEKLQGLLAAPPEAGSLNKALAVLREQHDSALARYEQALGSLDLPEVRLEGNAGLLVDATTGRQDAGRPVDATTGRQDAGPSVDTRLRTIEERLANIERVLEKLARRGDTR